MNIVLILGIFYLNFGMLHERSSSFILNRNVHVLPTMCLDIALCYYKLDFYDVSQEVLSVYLQKIPDSLIALNLKACNIYRLYNGRSAEVEIRTLLVS